MLNLILLSVRHRMEDHYQLLGVYENSDPTRLDNTSPSGPVYKTHQLSFALKGLLHCVLC